LHIDNHVASKKCELQNYLSNTPVKVDNTLPGCVFLVGESHIV
jgi:hypothetical protein